MSLSFRADQKVQWRGGKGLLVSGRLNAWFGPDPSTGLYSLYVRAEDGALVTIHSPGPDAPARQNSEVTRHA